MLCRPLLRHDRYLPEELILMARGLTGGGFDSFDAGP